MGVKDVGVTLTKLQSAHIFKTFHEPYPKKDSYLYSDIDIHA